MNKQQQQMLFMLLSVWNVLAMLMQVCTCNMLQYEMNYVEQHKQTTLNTSFVIQHELQQFYDFNMDVPLYVSIHNCNSKNYLTFANTTDAYNAQYHKLLGRTDRFFHNTNAKTTPPIHEDVTTHTQRNLSLNDDILLRQLSLTNNNNNNRSLTMFIMKNQFMSQYEQINLNEHSLNMALRFYDLNVFYNCDDAVVNSGGSDGYNNNNVLVVNKNEYGVIMNNSDDNDIHQQDELFINKYLSLNDYNVITRHNTVQHKIHALTQIASIMSVINTSNATKINLQNYLLTSQLTFIKHQLHLIQKTLIPLYYITHSNTPSFTIQLTELQQHVDTLMTYIHQFNFTKSDIGINLWYYIFTFTLLSIAVYILYLTLNEFKIAFQRKIA